MKRACVAARIVDSAKRGAANMSILTSRATKVPRRAEQVPSVVCLDATPERDVSAPIPRSCARLRGRIPASGARRGAEEGPLRGSGPRDAHGIGIETTRPRSAPRSHPASGAAVEVEQGPQRRVGDATRDQTPRDRPAALDRLRGQIPEKTRGPSSALRRSLLHVTPIPAPRSGAPAILAATPCGLARFWPKSAHVIATKNNPHDKRWISIAKIVTAQRVFRYVRGS
jgi:hypothetical protein